MPIQRNKMGDLNYSAQRSQMFYKCKLQKCGWTENGNRNVSLASGSSLHIPVYAVVMPLLIQFNLP